MARRLSNKMICITLVFRFVTYATPHMAEIAMQERPHTINGKVVDPKVCCKGLKVFAELKSTAGITYYTTSLKVSPTTKIQ